MVGERTAVTIIEILLAPYSAHCSQNETGVMRDLHDFTRDCSGVRPGDPVSAESDRWLLNATRHDRPRSSGLSSQTCTRNFPAAVRAILSTMSTITSTSAPSLA